MAINFPNAPAPNELFTTAYGTYKWDTQKWVVQEGFTGSFVSGGVVYSDTTTLLCSPAGTSGQILSSTGTGAPAWIDAETAATIKSKLGITTLSGSNTGDETTATIKTKLGVTTLSGSNTGDETTTTIKTKLSITTLSGSNTGDVTVSDDTTTDADYYPIFSTTTSGVFGTSKISSTKLSYNPSSGQLNATTFNSTSDVTKKENITAISTALDTINKIQGVKFSWKHNGATSFGFIAQDIEKILPDVVSTDKNGIKSVNYDATIAILLEAVKELNKKVEQLEKQ